MKASELYFLCRNGYEEYATRSVNDYIANVNNGDEEFDDTFLEDFFSVVNKDTSLLENGEFSAIFGEILAHALEVLIDSEDFEECGKYPIGISQYDADRLARKLLDSGHYDALFQLAEQLEFYETEHDIWEATEESDDDFGVDDDDFADYNKMNLIL